MCSTDMAGTMAQAEGGYRFIPGILAYSAGVAALPGFEVHRASFGRPVPVAEGFLRIRSHLESLGRPRAALCGCELRSPRPFTERGFSEFNEGYVRGLEHWGLVREGLSPVARSNVCPESDPPELPGFVAFSFTVEGPRAGFVVAGCGEVPEGRSNYRDHIVRRGDLSPEGLAEKSRWVFAEQERRLGLLGARWTDVTAVQVYTVHGVVPHAIEELCRRGAHRSAIRPERSRPPVVEIEFEMDCRRAAREVEL